jgi:hypothetical protein
MGRIKVMFFGTLFVREAEASGVGLRNWLCAVDVTSAGWHATERD